MTIGTSALVMVVVLAIVPVACVHGEHTRLHNTEKDICTRVWAAMGRRVGCGLQWDDGAGGALLAVSAPSRAEISPLQSNLGRVTLHETLGVSRRAQCSSTAVTHTGLRSCI